jgi:hypothetical protein
MIWSQSNASIDVIAQCVEVLPEYMKAASTNALIKPFPIISQSACRALVSVCCNA